MDDASILCRSDAERAAVVDLSRRLRPVSRAAIGLLLLAALVAVPAYGWLPPVAIGVAAGIFQALQARLDRFRRPEYALAASWLLAQAMVVAIVVLAEGPRELLLPLFAFPVVLVSVVWPRRVVVGAAGLSVVVLVGVAFVTEGAHVLATPPILTHQIALLVSTALVAVIARDAELASRRTAVVDPLTGTLNRAALDARARELEHQAGQAGRSVALLLADLDHFKAVNDEHGHDAGDRILREVAGRLQRTLPAFAGLYRFGGEEFAVVLPDVDRRTALATAERLRRVVASTPIGDVAVTVSIGVATTEPGERVDVAALLAAADAALYDAKDAGRDGVACADGPRTVVVLGRPAATDRRRAVAATSPTAVAPVRADVPGAGDGRSWLGDDVERRHLVDLARRLHVANPLPYAVAFAAVLLLGPWFGWWPIVPVALGALLYRAAEASLHRFRHPEHVLGAAWLAAQTANAAGFAVAEPRTGETLHFALPLLVVMVVGAGAVFPLRGAVLAVAHTAALVVGLALWMGPMPGVAQPAAVAFTLALLGAMGLIGSAVGRSAVRHRGDAVVDRLTGALNRRALEARCHELAHLAAATGAPVAVLLGDLDHFKAVNDRHGHARGDAALAEVAARLRAHLRAFEHVYRCGGEEFAVLLAGVSARDAVATAERLRAAVAAEPVAGLPLTMSFGVATSRAGEPFDDEVLRARADLALYEAKAAGRDAVRLWTDAEAGLPAAA